MLITRPVRRGSVLAISSVLFSADTDENRNPTTTRIPTATGNELVTANATSARPSPTASINCTVAGRGNFDRLATITAPSSAPTPDPARSKPSPSAPTPYT